jgi:hypothetical protein
MNFLGRDQRKTFVEVKAHLVAKHALGTRSSAVGLGYAMAGHVLHEVFVLTANGAHRGNSVKTTHSLNGAAGIIISNKV